MMTLIYRGQAYSHSNATSLVNSQNNLTYRGQSYQPSTSISIAPTHRGKLTYRGIPYVQPTATSNHSLTTARTAIA